VAGSLIALAVVVGLVVALSRSDSDPSSDPTGNPSGTSSSVVDPGARDAAAIATLSAQDRAIQRGGSAAYVASWHDDEVARQQARTVFDNLAKLHVPTLHARYVGADNVELSSSEQDRLGGTAWNADVDIAWRLAGIDPADAHQTLTYTFVQRPDGSVRVADIAASTGQRAPVWLLGPLDVCRSDRTLVASTSSQLAGRLDGLLRAAVVDVQRVLPSWHGSLVSYGPVDSEQFDRLVNPAPHAYEGVAAVTTTVDGSQGARAPVAIVVNPTVFGQLGPIGSRVVISHEATHVATDATTVSMPLWVAEGFADYVGVGAVDVPLSVSARAAVRDIRQFGLPDQLPSNAAFQARDGVEAVYEESWLAMQLIARDYGQRRLVDFYDAVLARPDDVTAALRSTLGTTEPALTRDWRAYLQEIAGGP
jgi:hypothetical protein